MNYNSLILLFSILFFSKARVLKFLYEKRISHMDLKPENILLTSIHKPILKVAGKTKA
jgi:serine/threonine protein kinase